MVLFLVLCIIMKETNLGIDEVLVWWVVIFPVIAIVGLIEHISGLIVDYLIECSPYKEF